MKKEIELVKELRTRTGASLHECIQCLRQSNHNVEQAIDLLRQRGKVIALQKSVRRAQEGVIICYQDGGLASLFELKSETDFAARNEFFKQSATAIAQILSTNDDPDAQIEKIKSDTILRIQENIEIGRFHCIKGSVVAGYVHDNKIGSIVSLKGGDETLARSIAMHIVAQRPLFVAENHIPTDMIEREKHIYEEQYKDKIAVRDRIVANKLEDFKKEVVLLKQKFIMNPDVTIEQLLKENNTSVIEFKLLSLK